MVSYKVSVIIPVYKVERFINKCATSLFEQSLKEVEFIFVDDASPDESINILKRCIECYPHRKAHIQILTHSANRGLPSARNTGLNIAKGEYIFHCDSDDFVERQMLEVLYNEGIKNDADIVWCDWFLSFSMKERYMCQQKYDTACDFLRGMLSGKIKYNVWNKLIKRDLYHGINFPDGHSMGEDMTMIRIAANARKVVYVPKAFYHYVKLNANSYTYNMPDMYLADIKFNTEQTIGFLKDRYGDELADDINYFKLDVKYPFLISADRRYYKLWKEWYPEANDWIMRNSEHSIRRRILQYMAWKGQFWFVWLHYNLVIRFIYGFIYK